MELNVIERKEIGDKKCETYRIGRYTVKLVRYIDGSIYIAVGKERADYLPEIYGRSNYEGTVLGFEIQTTSYGALSVEETKKMIDGLNEAIEVVEILTKEFVSK